MSSESRGGLLERVFDEIMGAIWFAIGVLVVLYLLPAVLIMSVVCVGFVDGVCAVSEGIGVSHVGGFRWVGYHFFLALLLSTVTWVALYFLLRQRIADYLVRRAGYDPATVKEAPAPRNASEQFKQTEANIHMMLRATDPEYRKLDDLSKRIEVIVAQARNWSPADEIPRLVALRDAGVITKEQFEWKKGSIEAEERAVEAEEREHKAQEERLSPSRRQVPVADELAKLVNLRDSGVLSHEEFEEQKRRLLS
jgi:hypothetical protein